MAKETILGTDVLDAGKDKINNNFTELYGMTGGAVYSDSVHTIGSPLVINQGTRVKITNNKNTIVDLNVPTEFTNGLWHNDKLVGVNDKDIMFLEIRFKAKSSVKNGLFDVELDIPSTGIIDAETKGAGKDANTEQRYSVKFKYYTRALFVANGCEIYINSDTGNISVYDIQIIPTRIHKGL